MRLISSTHNQSVPLPVPTTHAHTKNTHTHENSPPRAVWRLGGHFTTHTSRKIWVFQASLLIHKTLSTGVADDLLYIFCIALLCCCCCCSCCLLLLLLLFSFMAHASPCALREQLVAKPKQIEISFFQSKAKTKHKDKQINQQTHSAHTHAHTQTHAYVPIIRYLWGVSKSRLINFFKSFNK